MDIIGASKSGTGKTAAYILPILNKLQKVVKDEHKTIKALIIVPTIELADQVSRSLNSFGKYLNITNVKVQGGSHKSVQIDRLSKGCDIVVAIVSGIDYFIKNKKIIMESI